MSKNYHFYFSNYMIGLPLYIPVTADLTLMTELKETAQRWVWDCAFSGDSQYIITGIYKGRPLI
jgi:hypothetical protein